MDEYFEISELSIKEKISFCFNTYGLEGTEDIINLVYKHKDLTKIKNSWLDAYYSIIWK